MVVAGILRSIASLLPAAVALIAAVNVACAVLATAADSGCDVTYVLAVQVIRVFVVLLAIPLLARILTCRTT